MNIYVGNLAASTTQEDLKAAFEVYGAISSAKIIKDFETGISRGFGFVEMNQAEGTKAIAGLNGSELDVNVLIVNEAYEKRNNNNRRFNNNRRSEYDNRRF